MNSDDIQPVYGPTNPSTEDQSAQSVRRYGSVIELVPEKEQEYRKLHAEVWPEVVAAIKKANIRNYNIFVTSLKGTKYLVSYFEYVGDDPKKDFESIAKDPTTRDRWWPLTDACQKQLPGTPDGEQWLPMELVMQIE